MLKSILAIVVVVVVGAAVRHVISEYPLYQYLCGFLFGCIAIAAANAVRER